MAEFKELADVAAERAVLAGICQFGPEAYYEVADILDSNSFTFPTNQIAYKCVKHLIKDKEVQNLDVPSICSAATELNLSEVINKVDGLKYLRALFNFPVKKENIRRLAGKIRKLDIMKSLSTKMYDVGDQIRSLTGDEPISQILSIPETAVLEFSSTLDTHNECGLMGDNIDEYIEYLAQNQRETVGISTGYKLFDKAIGGGLLAGVNMVGARPKIGKTTFADNVGLNVASQTIPVLNLDTEMNKKNHLDRIIANLSGVDIEEVRRGKFAQNDFKYQKVRDAALYLKAIPYYYESVIGMDMDAIISIIRRWIMRRVGFLDNGLAKPCVVIYDYLKLASENSITDNIKEYQALGFQISALHNFVAKYEIPCLAFIQLNRDGINKEDTDVVSGSDRQVWTCTSLCIFKKKSEEEMIEDKGHKYNRKLVPIIARFAQEWEEGDYINMQMQGQFAKIVEGETRNNLNQIKAKGELVNDPETIPTEARNF